MEWWLLIPAGIIGIGLGLHPPFGLMLLLYLVLFVTAMLLIDPFGLGALFYIAFAMASGLPCLAGLWFRFMSDYREAEREAARWRRKYDDGMVP